MAALRVGDTVNVPGGMHGTLRYIGGVDGKKGTFAGVELAGEYATRGKNSGDVDGKHYFKTAVPGGGIFLPVDKAEKRLSGTSSTSTHSTKQASLRTSSVHGSPVQQRTGTPGTARPTPRLQKPSFSQSMGPGSSRTQSPTALKPPVRRESTARPTSPLRPRPSSAARRTLGPGINQTPAAGRLQTPKTRPSIGLAKSTIGAPGTTGSAGKGTGLRAPSLANGSSNKFSQSLRQSTSQTPSRMRNQIIPSTTSNTTPLGPDDRFDEEDTILEQNEPETTPTPIGRNVDRRSTNSADKFAQESQRLKQQLEERDKQLSEQAASIAEMERSLVELQTMLPDALGAEEDELPRDVQTLRAQLRDRNEKIKMLSEEFDANRADFRSTIDTLEMASNETERVYEQRVEDLLAQVQHLQERNDDVDSVAQQFKQLEELVAELEEGLEESRRAEAEARSEVEFLRGEVERSKSELRRERERHAAQEALEGGRGDQDENLEELQAQVTQKDDEIRGLKTIIQSLQGTAPNRGSYNMSTPTTPKANGVSHRRSKTISTNSVVSPEVRSSSDLLQRQIHDLESLLHAKATREEELQEEVRELRQSVNLSTANSKWSYHGGMSTALGLGHRRNSSHNDKHNSAGSQKTILGQTNASQSPGVNGHRRKDSAVPGYEDSHDVEDSGRTGSPLKDQYGIDSSGSEDANERRRRSAEAFKKPQAAPSVSEASTAAQWCEICEESGHDILNCANMIGSSTHRDPSPQPELRTGKDVVRESLRRSNGSGHLSYNDRPAPLRKSSSIDPPHPPPTGPLPPAPGRNSGLIASNNSGGSNRSSATPANSAQQGSSTNATPTKSTLIEGTGDQAGMLAGKTSGRIDPDRWCALCERDGHESVDCPVEDAF